MWKFFLALGVSNFFLSGDAGGKRFYRGLFMIENYPYRYLCLFRC